MDKLNYGKQSINADDKRAVLRVLNSDKLTQGEEVEAFERELAAYVGAKYAVACSNGTAALYMAYSAVPVEVAAVVTPSISFVATANMARAAGFSVEFADVDWSGMMVTPNNHRGIVAPVHMCGRSVDMNAIFKLNPIATVVEDACHALGGSYLGRKIGSCAWSKACVFSFHPVKSITTGEGGAVTTNSEAVYKQLVTLRNHGFEAGTHKQTAMGFNFRMSELQAALGRSQLKRLDDFIDARRKVAQIYCEALDKCCRVPTFTEDSAWHLYAAHFQERDKVRTKLMNHGINTQVHYAPIHKQPYWDTGKHLPGAEEWGRTELSLPIYPDMTEEDAMRVVAAVKGAV